MQCAYYATILAAESAVVKSMRHAYVQYVSARLFALTGIYKWQEHMAAHAILSLSSSSYTRRCVADNVAPIAFSNTATKGKTIVHVDELFKPLRGLFAQLHPFWDLFLASSFAAGKKMSTGPYVASRRSWSICFT